MWEVVEYVYLYTLLKYKTIPMCKDTQNNLKYEEKTDVFSFWPVNSIIKAMEISQHTIKRNCSKMP